MNNTQAQKFNKFGGFRLQRGLAFGLIIVTALLAFEMFNFSTTEFSLKDLLGGLTFFTIPWSTILAIAFCGIDFAGIARLFTPQEGNSETGEVWYLFGAWLLAATMNAMLTWWGVSLAILEHQSLGNVVIARATLLRIVPIFVALMVWLIRVLIIGTFSVAGKRLFTLDDSVHFYTRSAMQSPNLPPLPTRSLGNRPVNTPMATASYAPATLKQNMVMESRTSRPEPTYQPVGASANSINSNPAGRASFNAPGQKSSLNLKS